jgi:formylglycine-generating enzyme required for sulfatase activity
LNARNQNALRNRTRNGTWQWFTIGLVFGLGCATVGCLAAYVLGAVSINIPGVAVAGLPTPTVAPTYTPYPTYTPPPTYTTGAPTTAPITIPTGAAATNTRAAGTSQPAVDVPTQPGAGTTPIIQPTSGDTAIVGGTSPTPSTVIATLAPLTPAPSTDGNPSTLPSAQASQSQEQTEFLNRASPMAVVNGGLVVLGTTASEAAKAVQECVERDKGQCKIDDANDSTYPHSVVLNSFEIEKTEVSVDQYILFLNTLPTNSNYRTACNNQPCFAPYDGATFKSSPIRIDGTVYKPISDLQLEKPMVFVTWFGADAYCKALGRRLPTEAEWERAARRLTEDSTYSIYPWGNQWDSTLANSSKGGPNTATDVNSYSGGASAEEVLNLAGNAEEWVADYYSRNYYRENRNWDKPKGPASGTTRVVRGGSWATAPFFLRSVHRRDKSPTTADVTTGFRCARDVTGAGGATPVIPPGGASNPPALIPTKAPGTLTP